MKGRSVLLLSASTMKRTEALSNDSTFQYLHSMYQFCCEVLNPFIAYSDILSALIFKLFPCPQYDLILDPAY